MSQEPKRVRKQKAPPDLPPVNHVEAPPDHEFRDSEIQVQQHQPEPVQTMRGRKPRPPRTIITVRKRAEGKVTSIYSITIDMPANQAMKCVQEIAERCGRYSYSDLQGAMKPKGVML